MDSQSIQAYFHGAFHDGTSNRLHNTFRFCQKEREWLEMLRNLLERLGSRSWLYQEGSTRNLYVLETSARFLAEYKSPKSFQTQAEKISYIRGYFDAEGGIPSQNSSRFYIQFTQKNLPELLELKEILSEVGIESGRIHNPSVRVDPHYFRLFIASRSYENFVKVVNSWHPRKKPLLDSRMKI